MCYLGATTCHDTTLEKHPAGMAITVGKETDCGCKCPEGNEDFRPITKYSPYYVRFCTLCNHVKSRRRLA